MGQLDQSLYRSTVLKSKNGWEHIKKSGKCSPSPRSLTNQKSGHVANRQRQHNCNLGNSVEWLQSNCAELSGALGKVNHLDALCMGTLVCACRTCGGWGCKIGSQGPFPRCPLTLNMYLYYLARVRMLLSRRKFCIGGMDSPGCSI